MLYNCVTKSVRLGGDRLIGYFELNALNFSLKMSIREHKEKKWMQVTIHFPLFVFSRESSHIMGAFHLRLDIWVGNQVGHSGLIRLLKEEKRTIWKSSALITWTTLYMYVTLVTKSFYTYFAPPPTPTPRLCNVDETLSSSTSLLFTIS